MAVYKTKLIDESNALPKINLIRQPEKQSRFIGYFLTVFGFAYTFLIAKSFFFYAHHPIMRENSIVSIIVTMAVVLLFCLVFVLSARLLDKYCIYGLYTLSDWIEFFRYNQGLGKELLIMIVAHALLIGMPAFAFNFDELTETQGITKESYLFYIWLDLGLLIATWLVLWYYRKFSLGGYLTAEEYDEVG